MEKQLTKKLSVKCPKCQTRSDAFAGENEIETLTCNACQHVFKARFPKSARQHALASDRKSSGPDQPLSQGFEVDLASAAAFESTGLDTPLHGSQTWSAPKKPLRLNKTAMAIACGVTGGLLLIAGIAYFVMTFDYSAVDLSAFAPPPDTHADLFKDWKAADAKQASLLKTIDHKTDCAKLTGPYENLLISQQFFVSRAVKLGGLTSVDPVDLPAEDLPNYPVSRGGRRPVEILLTPQFRQLEARLNEASDVVLHYMTFVTNSERPKFSELPRSIESQIEIRIRLLETLARIERNENEESIGLEIYEIANSLSLPTPEETDAGDSYGHEFIQLLDSMRQVLSDYHATDPESGLAKSLAAFDKALAASLPEESRE